MLTFMNKEQYSPFQQYIERYRGVSPIALFAHLPDHGRKFIAPVTPDTGVVVFSVNKSYQYFTLTDDASEELQNIGLSKRLQQAMDLPTDQTARIESSVHMDSYGTLCFIHPNDNSALSEVSLHEYWPGYNCDLVGPEDIAQENNRFLSLPLHYARPGYRIPDIDEQFLCSYAQDIESAFAALIGMPVSAYMFGRN